MIMPASAITPSSETKPKGWLNTSRNSDTPIRPSGAVSSDQRELGEALQLQHQEQIIRKAITGIILKIEPWLLALSSLSPPTSMR